MNCKNKQASYRNLQAELRTLREQGLVRQDLKLNASQDVLLKTYQDYLNRHIFNPLSICVASLQ